MSQCKAVVAIAGHRFECQEPHPHPGRAHWNAAADCDWCSHGEAIAAERKQVTP